LQKWPENRVMTGRLRYIDRMKAQLSIWDVEIGKLRARQARANGDAKSAVETAIKEMQLLCVTAETRVKQVEVMSDQAWMDEEDSFEAAWCSLCSAARAVKARLN
jgi:hypothetical protein